jgi:chemotaxis protein methyltransferase WspC
MSAQAMLRHATGLSVSKAAADRSIRERMERTGSVNREEYLARLTPQELTELVELVVVPESWLFRDPQAFYAAVEFVRARLARMGNARPVRILSVPCAGGEEPYSMAMALCDAGVARNSFSIDAYDLSPGCIARARSGVYGRNAFRSQDLTFRDRYFTPIGNEDYQIDATLRAQVRFSQGNLLTLDVTNRPNFYDVIFCRNLLIYFDKTTTQTAIARLSAMLADDGVLFAGYAEVPSFAQNGFTPLHYRQAFGLKKDPAPRNSYAALPVISIPAGRPPVTGAGANIAPRAPAPRRNVAQPFATRAFGNAPMHSAAAAGRASAGMKRGPAAPAATSDIAGLVAEARALADRGQNKQAAAACQAVLAAAPENAEAYFILGMLSEHAQQPAQAEMHWRRCIYLQPSHYEALCHLALLAEQTGDSSGAAALRARAARIYQRRQAAADTMRTEP